MLPQIELMESPSSPNTSSGCGTFGCIGGVLFGGVGGGILLLLISLVWAVSTADPIPTDNPTIADVRVTLGEDFLNRMAQQKSTNPVKLDILPGNQIRLEADTSVTALGVSVLVQLQGLFGIEIRNQNLELRLIDVKIIGLDTPPELPNLFDQDIGQVNQNLAQTLAELSGMMGAPITLTGLGTTDADIWLEAREAP